MKNTGRYIAVIILLTLAAALPAQGLLLLEDNLEELAGQTDPTAWEDELQELAYLLEQPLDLNTATREQL